MTGPATTPEPVDIGTSAVDPPKPTAAISPRLVTLKKRAEFLRLRGGARWACPAFAMEMKPAAATSPGDVGAPQDIQPPRFGFTVTKALGNAVVRNRIRRRLRAAVSAVGVAAARPDHDYVIIARADAASLTFADLCRLVETAVARVHAPQSRTSGGRRTGKSAGGPQRPDK